LFSDTINFFTNDYKDSFLKNGFPEDSDFIEHQFYKSKPDYFATISRIDGKAGNDERSFTINVDREINFLEGLDYKLIFWFQRDLSNHEFADLIIFEGDENKDQKQQLLHCLFELAKRLSILINDYSDEYRYFIANADLFVDQDLEGILDDLDEIQNSYYLFNEYLDHKDFSMAIETLDIKLADKLIKDTRKSLIKKKRAHLPPELIQDLLLANNELNILFNTVQREHEAHKTQLANEFFKDNPHYFKVLKIKDLMD